MNEGEVNVAVVDVEEVNVPAPSDVPRSSAAAAGLGRGADREVHRPSGTPPCAVPVTVAASMIDPPRAIEADDGVLIVADATGATAALTVTHSPRPASLEAR